MTKKFKLKAGIDIGTMNIISARLNTDGKIKYNRIRDCFIELPPDKAKMLKLNKNVSYIQKEDKHIVLGDEAANFAAIFGEGLNRPLQSGVLSPSEVNAMAILKIMVGTVLGKPEVEGDICYFSCPADPIDSNFDTIFHGAMLEQIVSEFGWKPFKANEATANVFSEAADSGFSALSLSMGSGMCNCSLVFSAVPTVEFSIAKGGDWLDARVSQVTGETPERICKLKEEGVDLMHPKNNIESALVTYYKYLIDLMIKTSIEKLKQVSNVRLPDAIPLILTGGTSSPLGLVELVEKSIKEHSGFPFEISEVRKAEDPFNSVAKGLLIMAQTEE